MRTDLDIVRRVAERGLKQAQNRHDDAYIDIFQHLLDEIHRSDKILKVMARSQDKFGSAYKALAKE